MYRPVIRSTATPTSTANSNSHWLHRVTLTAAGHRYTSLVAQQVRAASPAIYTPASNGVDAGNASGQSCLVTAR
jgi:hypothetical protein